VERVKDDNRCLHTWYSELAGRGSPALSCKKRMSLSAEHQITRLCLEHYYGFLKCAAAVRTEHAQEKLNGMLARSPWSIAARRAASPDSGESFAFPEVLPREVLRFAEAPLKPLPEWDAAGLGSPGAGGGPLEQSWLQNRSGTRQSSQALLKLTLQLIVSAHSPGWWMSACPRSLHC
jgi:hypothetical protein